MNLNNIILVIYMLQVAEPGDAVMVQVYINIILNILW